MAVSARVVYRSDSATGPSTWANIHEINVPQEFEGPATNLLIAAGLRDMFLPLLLPNFFLDRVVVGTYVPDGQPYNPSTFSVLPVNLRGTRGDGPTEQALPLANVLYIRRLVDTGRYGRVFLRGFLSEGDIRSDGNGGVTLATPAVVQTAVDAAYAAYLSVAGAGFPFSLISGNPTPAITRPVTALSVAGIATKRLRTRRKTALVTGAIGSLQSILSDGVVGGDEIIPIIEAVGTIVRSIGAELPPLLPG